MREKAVFFLQDDFVVEVFEGNGFFCYAKCYVYGQKKVIEQTFRQCKDGEVTTNQLFICCDMGKYEELSLG